MVLKLYSFPTSPNVTRIAVILHEKKIPYELVPVKFYEGEHKTPAHLEKHPFGQVPYMDDDGFILYESWAIARYICEKYRGQGPDLIPADVQKRALADQAAAFEAADFHPSARTVAYEGFVKPCVFQQNTNLVKLEEARKMLEGKLDIYETVLSKQRYLAGDELTLADYIHLGYGALLPKAGFDGLRDEEKRPNVARWFKELESLPSWHAVKDGVQSYTPAQSRVNL